MPLPAFAEPVSDDPSEPRVDLAVQHGLRTHHHDLGGPGRGGLVEGAGDRRPGPAEHRGAEDGVGMALPERVQCGADLVARVVAAIGGRGDDHPATRTNVVHEESLSISAPVVPHNTTMGRPVRGCGWTIASMP